MTGFPLFSLAGGWRVCRDAGGQGVFRGRAVFSPAAAGLLYREEGEMRLASGGVFGAYRSYIYREEAGGFSVFFDESPPRLFHAVRLDACGRGTGRHLCGRDVYETEYDFSAPHGFSILHRVRGPRKDYEMRALYERLT